MNGGDPWEALQGLFSQVGNPYDQGLAMLAAANDPAMAGTVIDRMGIPAPGQQALPPGYPAPVGGPPSTSQTQPQFGQTPSPLGSLMEPQPPPMQPGLLTSSQMAPQLGYNPSSPGPPMPLTPGPAPGPNARPPQQAGMGPRIQQPSPVTPIMHGGVTGGVKVPEAQPIKGGAMPGALATLIQSVLGGSRQNPLTVPSLGSLISGR